MTRTRKIVLAILLAPVILIGLAAMASAYLMLYGLPVPVAGPGTARVACVGDSITFGNPFSAAAQYPKLLQARLGERYSVRNFGAPGFTAQRSGDHPYWQHRYFRLSTDFAPDVVIVMLGTNDAKQNNWAGTERFEQDYRALIQHYEALATKPRIILMTPPSLFLNGRPEMPYGMSAAVIGEIAERVKAIASDKSLPVVDIHAVTAARGDLFADDGIHPDADGQQLIADAVFEGLEAHPIRAPAPQR